MNEDIVLKFCVSYKNSTVHLCVNYLQNITKLVGHQWAAVLQRQNYLSMAPPLSIISAPAPAMLCHLKLYYNSSDVP